MDKGWNENLKIIKKISIGGTSQVFLCRNTCDEKLYAVKLYNEKFLHCMKKELEVLQTLGKHKYIVNLVDNTDTCLVLELVENDELYTYLETSSKIGKKLPLEIARYYFKQILEAVKYIHQNSIAHRDLKPSNIMLDKDFNIKIIDFGFAAKFKEDEMITSQSGTENYMSPQMLCQQKYNPYLNDVFTLGVILFELVNQFSPYYSSASSSDKLYRFFMQGRNQVYWDILKKRFNLQYTESFVSLINQMIEPIEAKRITLSQIFEHPWLNEGKTATQEEVQHYMKELQTYKTGN